MSRHFHTLTLALLLVVGLLTLNACRREQGEPASDTTGAAATTQQGATDPSHQTESGAGVLKDVIETDPRYIVGISFPPAAAKYPGLAAELRRYADNARADLLKSVAALGPEKPAAPFDLTLNFTLLSETAGIVAVAADGSSYTGGAHGTPLVSRFVWLPQQNKMMRSTDLLADAAGWRAVSEYVREQLHSTLSQRIDADELPPEQRAQLMQTIGGMIDDGTEPVPASFVAFEPVVAPEGGKLLALRFVFPPYQVGPYVDGNRSIEVPTAVLQPYLAPEYRDLFEGG